MMNWRMILYAWHVNLFFFMWQDKKRVPGSSLGEFSEWLNHVERQLDTVCFCMILAWESKDKTNGVEKKVVPSKDDLKENQVNFDVSGNHSISAISSSLGTDAVISPGILTSTPIKSNEGRKEMTSNDKTGDKIKIDDSCKRSAKLCQQDQQQLSSTSDQSSSNKNSGRRLWRLALHKQKVRKTWISFFPFFLEKLLLSLLLPSSSRNNWLLFHYERERAVCPDAKKSSLVGKERGRRIFFLAVVVFLFTCFLGEATVGPKEGGGSFSISFFFFEDVCCCTWRSLTILRNSF